MSIVKERVKGRDGKRRTVRFVSSVGSTDEVRDFRGWSYGSADFGKKDTETIFTVKVSDREYGSEQFTIAIDDDTSVELARFLLEQVSRNRDSRKRKKERKRDG